MGAGVVSSLEERNINKIFDEFKEIGKSAVGMTDLGKFVECFKIYKSFSLIYKNLNNMNLIATEFVDVLTTIEAKIFIEILKELPIADFYKIYEDITADPERYAKIISLAEKVSDPNSSKIEGAVRWLKNIFDKINDNINYLIEKIKDVIPNEKIKQELQKIISKTDYYNEWAKKPLEKILEKIDKKLDNIIYKEIIAKASEDYDDIKSQLNNIKTVLALTEKNNHFDIFINRICDVVSERIDQKDFSGFDSILDSIVILSEYSDLFSLSKDIEVNADEFISSILDSIDVESPDIFYITDVLSVPAFNSIIEEHSNDIAAGIWNIMAKTLNSCVDSLFSGNCSPNDLKQMLKSLENLKIEGLNSDFKKVLLTKIEEKETFEELKIKNIDKIKEILLPSENNLNEDLTTKDLNIEKTKSEETIKPENLEDIVETNVI